MGDHELIRLLQTAPEKGVAMAVELYGGLVQAIVGRFLPDRRDREECMAGGKCNRAAGCHHRSGECNRCRKCCN